MKPLSNKFPGVFSNNKLLYTKNLVPGQQVYGERLVRNGKYEFREWDPRRSKLAAAILKKISQMGLKEGSAVLYLGAASGTTASHVSDIVGKNGFVFAIDSSPYVLRDLVLVCEKRKNIVPILADANQPQTYVNRVSGVDFVYQDVAQRNQVEIFLKNCKFFLKPGGFGAIAVKARSIDVTKKPKQIFKQVLAELENGITVVDHRDLSPFEKDHAFFVCKRKT
ncbi:fibrillarin-like rRNA/tRNA 2'-O-methyltransferase [Candidatus Woesearchaeota archaeon]|nr:MAG: fibrillarin-like rRNA/tRNA 2'-O-methyltransferase [Candidatus Woesearchaeota archaeon]